MTKPRLKTYHLKNIFLIFGLVFALGIAAKAASITNNFDSVYNYVANGIIGDTNWDGVYLGFGDIPGGGLGGSGAGRSVQADTTLQAPPIGFLSVATTGSDWSGNGDDGFYAWKLVSGDFDVSVQSAPPWQSQNNNFAGLLVRAWNPSQSGARVSFTSTNSSENFLALFRAQQFGLGEIRQATNGANIENTFPEASADTGNSRYYRIKRTGDTFTFYVKTNLSDAWSLITYAGTGGGYTPGSGSITRSDWSGQPVQVGIAQAIFAVPGTPAVDYFTDFELSGPNVNSPSVVPAAPSSLVTSSPNPNGSLTFSWTAGGGNGSILIIRKIAPGGVLVQNPVQGLTYTANTSFPTNTTLIAGNTHVVYAGPGTSVTVTGLGGSNNIYAAEVLSYNNAGPSIIYNTASPATLGFLGTGLPASITTSVTPAPLPVGGAARAQVIANFSTGEQVDVTTDPSITLVSSDPTITSVNNGVLTALQAGSVTITATYGAFNGLVSVTNTPPRFTDNFSTTIDYTTNGLPGSTWDGLNIRPGDVPGPGTDDGGDTMFTTVALATTNILSVRAGGTTWEGTSDDGFYLFKYVPGDFQAVVHVDLTSHGAYQFAGLMARAASATGGPFTGGEHNMAWWFFDQFGVPTSLRATINGNAVEQNLSGTTPVNTMWLLLQRINGTNFVAYYKQNATDPWLFGASSVDASMAGVIMQIGLAQSTFTSSPDELVQFDSFMLDGTGLIGAPPVAIPLPATNFVMTFNPDTSMTLKWYSPTANDGTAPAVSRSLVIMRAGAPVSAQPYVADGIGGDQQAPNTVFGLASDNLGSDNYAVYRTTAGDTNNNQQVTVSGLSPGVTYYAAVYTFNGLGNSRTFNTVTGAKAVLVDGNLTNIESVLLGNGIPLGGVGSLVVNGIFTGGGKADISPSVHISSANLAVMATTNGVLTGIGLGSTVATIDYAGFTNQLSVTVRNPSFTDNFGTSHDYLANGVTGTPWDGVYKTAGDIPDTTYVSASMSTMSADANITAPNILSIANLNAGFEFNQNDGFFLFKYVPADFQVAVNLAVFTNNGTMNYNNSGVMARGYTVATNGTLGAPLHQSGNECWVDWVRFDEFGNGTRMELTIDNGTARPFNPDVNSPDHYMLMVRQNGTNFAFYQRTLATDPWHSTTVPARKGATAVAAFAGQPMQVGVVLSGFDSGVVNTVGFSNFMLDISSPGASITTSGTNVIVSWPGSPSVQLQYTTTLSPPNWQPVVGTPVFANGLYNLTLPASAGSLFFRLKD